LERLDGPFVFEGGGAMLQTEVAMTKFKNVFARAALAAFVIGGTAAVTTSAADARVVCNRWHCWHTYGYYGDPYYDGYYGPGLAVGFGFGGGYHHGWHGGGFHHGGFHGGGFHGRHR
jgi:hypothetical protein